MRTKQRESAALRKPSCYVMAFGAPDSYSSRRHPRCPPIARSGTSGRPFRRCCATHDRRAIKLPRHSPFNGETRRPRDNQRRGGSAAVRDPEGFHITSPRFPMCRSESGAKRLKRAKACVRTRRAHPRSRTYMRTKRRDSAARRKPSLLAEVCAAHSIAALPDHAATEPPQVCRRSAERSSSYHH
jgi:hypothetical protein